MTVFGWLFTAVLPTGGSQSWAPSGGSLSMEIGRDVTRTVGSVEIDPATVGGLDLSGLTIHLDLSIDGVSHRMGTFAVGAHTVQEGVVLTEAGAAGDMIYASLLDSFIGLRSSSPAPRTLVAGADPALAMRGVFDEAGIPAALAAPVSSAGQQTTWQPFVTFAAQVTDLAVLAGHRPPWCDPYGVARSVSAVVTAATPTLPVESLNPHAGTVATTRDPTAPNVFVVFDTSAIAAGGAVGEWRAPATAENSEARTGRRLVVGVSQQGLAGNAHAQAVAEALGQQGTARKLTFSCDPTPVLDGPVLLSHDGGVYVVSGWSVSLTGAQAMAVTATEVTDVLPLGA